MSTDRSDRVYFSWLDSAAKFDYYVTGVALALVGFLGATFTIGRFGLNPSTLELGALGAFLAATIVGFKHLESQVSFLSAMHRRLYEEESAGAIASAASQGRTMLNTSTGRVYSTLQLVEQLYSHKVGTTAASERLDELVVILKRRYRNRNAFLLGGFCLLVLARILPAILP
ncbi:MAG: hypothetical protein HOP28_16860 [Gemmatimonadales bacterium]|nr:hypothetical protein [Gemmatimonadales bacterium]